MAKPEVGVYVISVAAELAGMHPQTLRMYERRGLLTPGRTPGRTRRYSPADIERLKRIHHLTQVLGANLAGARMVLDLEEQLDGVRRQMARMAERMAELEEHVSRQMDRLARETVAIMPASQYRSLEDLLKEVTARGHGTASAL